MTNAEDLDGRTKEGREKLFDVQDEDGSLHVVRATTKLNDYECPKLEATFREEQYEAAEELTAGLESHLSPDYSFTIWEEREDGTLVDYYTDVEPDVTIDELR